MTDTPNQDPIPTPTTGQPGGAAPEDAGLGIPAPAPDGADAGTPASAPAPKKKSNVVNPYVWGTGRRKSSVARVRIKPGTGKFMVNKKEYDTYFCLDKDRQAITEPLRVTDNDKAFDVFVNVSGGGFTGQSGAIVLGLSRALAKASSDSEAKLREKNLLSRDPRRVERKKYGLRGARRSYQFSKR
ncbi:MAG: 30S ribosomal protein S9 [Planctomycetota bacterium]